MFAQRFIAGAATAFLFTAAIGCQSSSAPVAHAQSTPDQAIIVSSGNGGGTAVFLPPTNGGQPLMLCTSGVEQCPECQAAAAKYYKTGVLDPKCSRTGATRTLARPVTPSYSVN